MVFKTALSRQKWEGLLACTWIVLIDILLLIWMARRPVDATKFLLIVLFCLSLPLLAHLAYRTWSIFTLEYWVDRNALTISWAGIRQIVPLHTIKRIIDGEVQDLSHSRWSHWPASHMRVGRAMGLLNLQLLATRPLSDCLLVDTGNEILALSPAHKADFLDVIQERFELGPAISVRPARAYTGALPRVWWLLNNQDAVGKLLMFAGGLGVFALFGLLMIRFPNLPSDLVMRYNADGSPEVIRSKSALFLLPLMGLMTWVVNGLWGVWMAARKQPIGAYLLWGGAVVVQLFALLALAGLMI